MDYEIICPYCFKKFLHTEVHFRSERVITDAFAEAEEDIFFQETEDEKYEHFWDDKDEGFGGTTEFNPADDKLGVLAYRRKVIDPFDAGHQKYIKKQQEGYLVYDDDQMVSQIELTTGELCSRRVCPHCHNPLSPQYGKYPVKFTTVIGITGAGKTVYLSQLINRINKCVTKVGMIAVKATPSARQFLQNNRVDVGVPLPGSTARVRLQQPLFYDLVKSSSEGTREIQTLVLYDVAGENCVDRDLMHRFGRFIENADGIIVLIDPMQFDAINNISSTNERTAEPIEVLSEIHNLVVHGSTSRKCEIPMAVCISKTDIMEIQEAFDPDLHTRLMDDVQALRDSNGREVSRFHASDYNPIAEGLHNFIRNYENELEVMMYNNYTTYNYFAFTALGCDVAEGKPVGPLLPKRIEEPLLWLFHKYAYIETDVDMYEPNKKIIHCPECDSTDVYEFTEPQEIVIGRLFNKKKIMITHECRYCQHKW